MDKDIQRFDIIQNYLDGNMSAVERQAFEAQMATDTALADEVGVHRLEREMMDIMLEDDLDKQLQSWQQEKAPMQPDQPKRANWRTWGIIAILGIAILLLILYLMRRPSENTRTPSTDQLNNSIQKENNLPANDAQQEPAKKKDNGPVADSQKKSSQNSKQQNNEMIALAEELGGTPEFAGTFVRSGDEAKSRFDSASIFIDEKRYDEAIRLLQTIPNDNQEVYLNARLNLGYLYFIKKNFKASIPHLEFITTHQDYLYAETADWYLLLAYLAAGQPNKFEPKLAAMLADPEHSYYQKARQLKDRLN